MYFVTGYQNYLGENKLKTEYNLYSLRKRIFASICVISFIFLLLIARLFYIQVISAPNLQAKAESQWTRDLPITAERGKIYDSNGAALAVSYTTYNVYTRYKEIKDLNVHVDDSFMSNEEGKKVLNIVLDSEDIIDLNKVTDASRIINKIMDTHEELLQDCDELDIYSKEKGVNENE